MLFVAKSNGIKLRGYKPRRAGIIKKTLKQGTNKFWVSVCKFVCRFGQNKNNKMKLELQYVTDIKGNPKMVQRPLSHWKKVVSKLEKYEQALQLKQDLEEAFAEVETMKKTIGGEKTLSLFIDEL